MPIQAILPQAEFVRVFECCLLLNDMNVYTKFIVLYKSLTTNFPYGKTIFYILLMYMTTFICILLHIFVYT